ncbi:MAG: hypothetical protein AAF191_09225 [Verrucomicrobiota bacterium]
MTDFFQNLVEEAGAAGLDFLLVGGNAINTYGYQRTTVDADLLIREEDLALWKAFWETRGYRCFHQTDAFSQFQSKDETERFPVDLMIVASSTYEKLASLKQTKSIGEAELSVPAPLHLIALKLHALRSKERAADGKDIGDIVGLIRACDIEIEDLHFQEVFQRYADEETRLQLLARLRDELDGGPTDAGSS